MILYIYAVLAYVSTPYMTGEHGINWMMMIVLMLCVYIFMELYGKYFCCICCDSSEFPSPSSCHYVAMKIFFLASGISVRDMFTELLFSSSTTYVVEVE